MNIYVGNLPYAATETDLEELFGEHGQVATATIIRDRNDGRSKGFGFVEMENQEDGERAIEALDGQEMMGRPLKVNPARPREQRPKPRSDQKRENSPRESKSPTEGTQGSSPDGDLFHNPYTFVPTPSRQKAIKRGGFAGDFNPLKHPCGQEHNLDHASLKDNLWTGHVPIKLTVVTPLVLLKDDGRERDPKKHQTYDVLDYIPESSLRGMLRSAYEVVTNSRYGCFSNDDRLAYRMRPQEALDLIPAIIEDGGSGNLVARLYTGDSTPTDRGPSGPMYAAMLPLYHRRPTTCHGGIPKTGDEVNAEIVKCRHRRGYFFSKAIQVCQSTQTLTPSGTRNAQVITGRVLITNKNMRNKHDERIFFNPQPNVLKLTNDVKEAWRMRIKSYREAHSDSEVFGRSGANNQPWKNIGSTPGKTAWSPHLYQDNEHRAIWRKDPHGRSTTHDAIELQPGDMVYARCKFDPTTGQVTDLADLFPVMISRELYTDSPKTLLDTSLRPASQRSELSPAGRLFGWVPQEQVNESGYKSRIRVVCEDGPRPEIIQDFNGQTLPLTILGQPKPAQGRFYVADADGEPQHKVDKQKAGYDASKGKSLRGRKQYWHHKGLEVHKQSDKPAEGYWQPSVEDRTQIQRNGRYQEYRRPDKFDEEERRIKPQTDPQNRSIKGWIKPGTEFKVSLYVQNLQDEEVGALLWLLTLSELYEGNYYFRLGYGKPLGFGSVRLKVDNGHLPLGTGKDWKEYYAALDKSPPATLDKNKRKTCMQAFEANMVEAYNTDNTYPTFDDIPFICDFLQVLSGPTDDAPIHYPRLDPKPAPEGENFRWFTENEKEIQKALPAVYDSKGLPYKP